MHQEYINDKKTDTVLLFIHGILGSPNHFKPLLQNIPRKYAIHNILLDGHGKSVADFSRTSMARWRKQVETKLQYLSQRYQNIIIIAHSMGTLLAIEFAVQYPKVRALYLMNVPFAIHLRLRMIYDTYKILFEKIKATDFHTQKIKDAYSIEMSRKLYLYLRWIPRYLELFGEIYRVKKQYPNLLIPCKMFHSKKDELVSNRTFRRLKKNPNAELFVLRQSGHFYYHERDCKVLERELYQMLYEIQFQKKSGKKRVDERKEELYNNRSEKKIFI